MAYHHARVSPASRVLSRLSVTGLSGRAAKKTVQTSLPLLIQKITEPPCTTGSI